MTQKGINVFFLIGNFDQRRKIVRSIKKALDKFDFYICDDRTPYQQLEQQVREGSCFGDKKLILVNAIPATKKSRNTLLNNLKKLLSDVPENCIVILNNLKISSKVFLSHIEQIGKICNFDQKKTKVTAKHFITGYFVDKKKTISNDDAFFIVDSLGFQSKEIDVDSLNLVLKKIDHYVGNKKKISHQDIVDVCSHSESFIIWDLFNSLDSKDLDKSMVLMERSLSFAQDSRGQAIMIIYSLLRRYKLLLMAFDGLTKKKTKEEIWGGISKLTKMERKGSNVRITMSPKEENPPLYSKRAFDSLFNSFYGRKPVISCYKKKDLLFIDYALRQSLMNIYFEHGEPEVILMLNVLCMVICGALTTKREIQILNNKNCIIN